MAGAVRQGQRANPAGKDQITARLVCDPSSSPMAPRRARMDTLRAMPARQASPSTSRPAAAFDAELFTDGACSGNPGPGGWGFILRVGGSEREGSGGETRTTNNRMELLGAIEGLKLLERPSRVRLVSDSQYLVKGLNEWLDVLFGHALHASKYSKRIGITREPGYRAMQCLALETGPVD